MRYLLVSGVKEPISASFVAQVVPVVLWIGRKTSREGRSEFRKNESCKYVPELKSRETE